MRRRSLCFFALLSALGILPSCRGFRDEVLLISLSPNSSQKLMIIMHVHGADASLSMELIKGHRMISIYADRGDRVPGLTEVYWSLDSRVIGVLVCDPASQNVIVGYDSKREQPVSPVSVTEPVRKLLTNRYGLTTEALADFKSDPIVWACSQRSGALERFRKQLDTSRHLPTILVNTSEDGPGQQ
jgi:hypothetical protein